MNPFQIVLGVLALLCAAFVLVTSINIIDTAGINWTATCILGTTAVGIHQLGLGFTYTRRRRA